MRQLRLFLTTAATVMAGFSAIAATAHGKPAGGHEAADMVMINGTIVTMEGEKAIVEALAIRNGKIQARGSDAAIERFVGPRTKTVDLQKKTVLPGFIDAHGHLSIIRDNVEEAPLQPPPIAKVSDIASLLETLRAQARAYPDGPIKGFGYDNSMLAERRHPTRHELDTVSTDRPIIAFHQSGHLAALNTKALELLGMLKPKADPEGGKIWREADGVTASGVVEERAVFATAALQKPDREKMLRGLVRAQDIYASYGVTTAQDGGVSLADYALLTDAAQRGLIKIDVDILLRNWLSWPDKAVLLSDDTYRNHLRVAGIKLLLDGSLQGRTGWLTQPYYTASPNQSPDFRGYPHMNVTDLVSQLSEAARNGWHVFAHVNGDAAIQQYLDAIKTVNGEGGRKLEQPVAIHAQYTRRDQLVEMKALSVVPTFFASHSFYWGDWHREVILGPQRADHISPQRSAIDLGLNPTTHNNSPVVPPNMMRLVWSSVTRRTRSGDILGPEERVTPYEALKEITINAALQMRSDDRKGTITPGKMADIVILDQNPLTMPSEQIASAKVVATLKEGVLVYGALP